MASAGDKDASGPGSGWNDDPQFGLGPAKNRPAYCPHPTPYNLITTYHAPSPPELCEQHVGRLPLEFLQRTLKISEGPFHLVVFEVTHRRDAEYAPLERPLPAGYPPTPGGHGRG